MGAQASKNSNNVPNSGLRSKLFSPSKAKPQPTNPPVEKKQKSHNTFRAAVKTVKTVCSTLKLTRTRKRKRSRDNSLQRHLSLSSLSTHSSLSIQDSLSLTSSSGDIIISHDNNHYYDNKSSSTNFKGQDLPLLHALSILRKRTPAERKEIKRLVDKILESGGCGRFARDGKYDDLVRQVLIYGDHMAGKEKKGRRGFRRKYAKIGEVKEWSEEARRWEMKKFAGVAYYAFKILEGQAFESTESVPHYLQRTYESYNHDGSVVPKLPITLLSTYTPDGRELRAKIERYLPQLFNIKNWKHIAPLMWCIQPKASINPSMHYNGKPNDEDESLKPKIIVIQVPGGDYLLYRYFPFGNEEWEEFMKGIAGQGEGLSGEIRFANAVFEKGVEVCMTVAEAGWLVGLGGYGQVYGYRVAEVTWRTPGEDPFEAYYYQARAKAQLSLEYGSLSGGEGDEYDVDEDVEFVLVSDETKKEIMHRFKTRSEELMKGLVRGGGDLYKSSALPVEKRRKIKEVKLIGYYNQSTYLGVAGRVVESN
ncbi:hypothetical protein TWF694_002024 [Orbilia ellipsospora]|uniref:Uncharacterized protein n=1 Tax=Orbilia ellipsospora TaxID=2528407 RepID=A0AAV9XAI4_9PEZI